MTMYSFQAWIVRGIASLLLRNWYGPRCRDYEPTCERCQRWQALDTLVLDPFDKMVEEIRSITKKQSLGGPVPIPEISRRFRNVHGRWATREEILRAIPDMMEHIVEEYPNENT